MQSLLLPSWTSKLATRTKHFILKFKPSKLFQNQPAWNWFVTSEQIRSRIGAHTPVRFSLNTRFTEESGI